MYPKTLSVVVNSQDQEDQILAIAGKEAKQEFPKAMYLHPKDKSVEDRVFVVVHNEDEKKAAAAKGYNEQPHVPEVDDPEAIDGPKVVLKDKTVIDPQISKKQEPETPTKESKEDKVNDKELGKKK